jgi:8-oxo-dGTP diphosphatase
MVRVVAAIIKESNRYLLARRSDGPRAGLWEFPGGKIEAGEDAAGALCREIAEELGIGVVVGRSMARVVHEYDDLTIELIALEAEIVSGRPRPSVHSEITWATEEELHALRLSGADRVIARKLVNA